jgi:hypothetical protein
MKKSFSLKLAGIALITLLAIACGKKSDPTPAPAATAKVFSTTVNSNVNGGVSNVTGTVTVTDGVAYLKMIGTISSGNIDHVYITSSQDNGPMSPFIPEANYTDSAKNTFKVGSITTESYTVGNTKNFVLTVQVPVRNSSAAVSDVYRIWFTNGKGAFTAPTSHMVLGPVTFTLNYVANAGPSYTTNTGILLGDQYASPGSLLVTSGQISALGTAAYDTVATSADVSLSELGNSGVARTNTTLGGAQGSGALYFVSPSERANLGYSNEPSGANITNISIATVDFATANGTTLNNLSVGSSTKVMITQNNVYQFITAAGKKGLIKVTNMTATSASAGGTVTVSVKVLN